MQFDSLFSRTSTNLLKPDEKWYVVPTKLIGLRAAPDALRSALRFPFLLAINATAHTIQEIPFFHNVTQLWRMQLRLCEDSISI